VVGVSPLSRNSAPAQGIGVAAADASGHVVLTFEWNALRTGDRVLVHDDSSDSFTLWEGEVTLVQTRGISNEVAVRGAPDAAAHAVVRPRRLAAHLSPLDPNEPCWRCDIIANSRRPRTSQAAG